MNELGTSRALYRGALFLLVIFIVALILHELIWVIVQLFVASIIAAAMTPLVNSVVASERVRRWRRQPPRGLVVLVMYLLAALIAVTFGFVVVRAIVREIAMLLENLPQYGEAFNSWLASVVAAYPGVIDTDLQTWIAINVRVALGGLPVALGGMLAFVVFATSLLGGFLAVLFTVFMALYLTIDAPRMRDYLVVFWPRDRQPRVSRMSIEMGARLGQWAIGQSVLCVIIGGGAWLGVAAHRRALRRLARPGLGARRVRARHRTVPVGHSYDPARVHRLARDRRRRGRVFTRLESGGKQRHHAESDGQRGRVAPAGDPGRAAGGFRVARRAWRAARDSGRRDPCGGRRRDTTRAYAQPARAR